MDAKSWLDISLIVVKIEYYRLILLIPTWAWQTMCYKNLENCKNLEKCTTITCTISSSPSTMYNNDNNNNNDMNAAQRKYANWLYCIVRNLCSQLVTDWTKALWSSERLRAAKYWWLGWLARIQPNVPWKHHAARNSISEWFFNRLRATVGQ